MNTKAKHILELGIFFAGAVIILDTLLIQIPVLDWFALGLAFFLAAALIISSIARTIPWQRRTAVRIPQTRNELQHLADIIDAAVYGGDSNSSKILSEEIRSIVLGVVAVRTKLSKREIIALAENHPENLRVVVRDDEIIKFLTGHSFGQALGEKELEETLSKIEDWSR